MASLASPITYPSILTTASWKKSKGLFTLSTGVSECLRTCEAAFKSARADIDEINNCYKQELRYSRLNEYNVLKNYLAELVKSTASGPVAKYKKALWEIRDHAKKTVAEKKNLSSGAKKLLLEMAQTADLESVNVNQNTVGGYLSKVLANYEKSTNETLLLLFGPANLNKRIAEAEKFVKDVAGKKTPAEKVAAFRADVVTTTRNLNQIIGNRSKSAEKYHVEMPNSNVTQKVFDMLHDYAGPYKPESTTEQTVTKQLAEIAQALKLARTIASTAPTATQFAR